MKKTAVDRKNDVVQFLTIHDKCTTLREKLTFVYTWYRYEYAFMRMRHYKREMDKFRNSINDQADVIEFRDQLKNL